MTTTTSTRRGTGLAARLLAAIALVVVAAGLTAWIVAAAIGPAIFHDHMVQGGVSNDASAVLHAEEAFASAGVVSLTVALAAAILTSLAVSVFLTRRIGRSLASLSAAASRVAGGQFDSPVRSAHLGVEFDDLAAAFNHMAGRLDESESLRRRLLADVAHELRTPVATLGAYVEALEDGVETLSPQTIAVLRDQTSRLTRLAQDLAAVTRAQSGDLRLELELVDPRQLVLAAVGATSERFAGRGVALVADVQAAAPRIMADGDRLAQVLANLLDNALRHTRPGGHVTVTARSGERGRVLLCVTDDGDGIGAEHLPHVFERFYRADTARDRDHGGSGIGLAITKALVEAHGGSITGRSSGPGQGSEFEICLPTVDAER